MTVDGPYVLGPIHIWTATWTAPSDENLEVVLPRDERLTRHQELV
ncbi:hypothetical protein [Streptomyces sp. NPDC002276]